MLTSAVVFSKRFLRPVVAGVGVRLGVVNLGLDLLHVLLARQVAHDLLDLVPARQSGCRRGGLRDLMGPYDQSPISVLLANPNLTASINLGIGE